MLLQKIKSIISLKVFALALSLFLIALFLFSSKAKPELKIDKAAGFEVTVYKSEKTFKGLTLVPITARTAEGTEEVHLINMDGTVVNRWALDVDRARLLPNGNILVIHGSRWGRTRPPWSEMRQIIREYNWEGEVKWEYVADDVAHHDLQRLPNGNTIFLGRALVPPLIQSRITDEMRRAAQTRSDSVVEVTPEGEIVWEWLAHDHLDVNYCGARGCDYLQVSKDASKELEDWTHVNTVHVLPENKWYEKGDQRFKPGNVMIMPRNWWTALIVDRESGKLVWEYNGDYRGGISGGHEPHMIEKGFPGAGNILIFDNGTSSHLGESIALEINPVTKEVVWTYEDGENFHSRTRGSLQRLKNGNTLISEDTGGRVFEVTAEGEIVWEYKGEEQVSRAQRYPYDYCERCKQYALD
jgi:hypothetical protein